jgi:hypothetical protein
VSETGCNKYVINVHECLSLLHTANSNTEAVRRSPKNKNTKDRDRDA